MSLVAWLASSGYAAVFFTAAFTAVYHFEKLWDEE